MLVKYIGQTVKLNELGHKYEKKYPSLQRQSEAFLGRKITPPPYDHYRKHTRVTIVTLSIMQKENISLLLFQFTRKANDIQ